MWNWLRLKYYDWYIDTFLFINRNNYSMNTLNPFGENLSLRNETHIEQNEQRLQMEQGLRIVRKQIRNRILDNSKEGWENELGKYQSSTYNGNKDLIKPDILDLADDNEVPEWKKFVQRNFIAKKADVSSRKDKRNMINSRIEHFQELQIKKQIRKINRQLRKAEQEGNKQIASELRGKIHELTRKLREERPHKRLIP